MLNLPLKQLFLFGSFRLQTFNQCAVQINWKIIIIYFFRTALTITLLTKEDKPNFMLQLKKIRIRNS